MTAPRDKAARAHVKSFGYIGMGPSAEATRDYYRLQAAIAALEDKKDE